MDRFSSKRARIAGSSLLSLAILAVVLQPGQAPPAGRAAAFVAESTAVCVAARQSRKLASPPRLRWG